MMINVETGTMFKQAMGAMLELMRTRKPNVKRDETLAIMKLRDVARK